MSRRSATPCDSFFHVKAGYQTGKVKVAQINAKEFHKGHEGVHVEINCAYDADKFRQADCG